MMRGRRCMTWLLQICVLRSKLEIIIFYVKRKIANVLRNVLLLTSYDIQLLQQRTFCS